MRNFIQFISDKLSTKGYSDVSIDMCIHIYMMFQSRVSSTHYEATPKREKTALLTIVVTYVSEILVE